MKKKSGQLFENSEASKPGEIEKTNFFPKLKIKFSKKIVGKKDFQPSQKAI